jgi:hypothetical protein
MLCPIFAPFKPGPQWTRNRTLPVLEFAKEKGKLRFDHEPIDWLAAVMPHGGGVTDCRVDSLRVVWEDDDLPVVTYCLQILE